MNSPVDELKPRCPACKSINLMIETWSSGDCSVFDAAECMDCHTKVNDVRKWNTRAESPDSVETCDYCNARLNAVGECDNDECDIFEYKPPPPPVAGGEIAKHLAEELFKIGDFPTPCHRIEFKGGEYPDKEKAQGGMNRAAMEKFFNERLAALQHQDGVVMSEEDLGELIEAAEFTLENFTQEIQPIQSPIHEMVRKLTGVIGRAKQSLERKNGQ